MNAFDEEWLAKSAEDLLLDLRREEGSNADVAHLLSDPWTAHTLDEAIGRRIHSPQRFGLWRRIIESNVMMDFALLDKVALFARLLEGKEIP